MNIGLGLVFLAGLVSFLTPCVLSLIPVYIGLLGGTVEEGEENSILRRRLLFRTLTFIASFSLVFVLMGMSGTIIGGWLYPIKSWIARIGGLLIILFGLQVTGILNLPMLNRERMMKFNKAGASSTMGALLMGIAFSAGWSPCIGPILGALLTAIVASHVSLARGALDLAIYSAGMAVPFLLLSLGMGKGIELLRKNHQAIHTIQIVSGIVMIIMGVLLVTGITSRLNIITWKLTL